MGSISVIWNPKSWMVFNQGESSRIQGDLVYQMIIGEGEDANHKHYTFVEWISKTNYEKIIDGTYTLLRFPNSEIKVLLFNECGKLISLVNGTVIDDTLLDESQLEAINKLQETSPMKLQRSND